MLLTKTHHLAETVRKFLARGAGANGFNVLNRLHPSDIAELLPYAEKRASRIMNPDVFSLNEDMKVREAIEFFSFLGMGSFFLSRFV